MLDVGHVFNSFPVLGTQRFILRAVTMDDVDDIFHIRSNEQVTRYLGQQPMTSTEQAVRQVEMYANTFEAQQGIAWGVASPDDNRIIGTCVLWHLNLPNFRAEIGYMLAPEWRGKGVMVEAVSAELDYVFGIGFHSVEAQTDPANIASNKLLEKLGFVQEAYFRENWYDAIEDKFTDTAVFSLLKSTWLNR